MAKPKWSLRTIEGALKWALILLVATFFINASLLSDTEAAVVLPLFFIFIWPWFFYVAVGAAPLTAILWLIFWIVRLRNPKSNLPDDFEDIYFIAFIIYAPLFSIYSVVMTIIDVT